MGNDDFDEELIETLSAINKAILTLIERAEEIRSIARTRAILTLVPIDRKAGALDCAEKRSDLSVGHLEDEVD